MMYLELLLLLVKNNYEQILVEFLFKDLPKAACVRINKKSHINKIWVQY